MAVTINHMEAEELPPSRADDAPRPRVTAPSPNSEEMRRMQARLAARAEERLWRRHAD